MERTMSVEDKIRRAEEIYVRRKEGTMPKTTTVSINNDNKKELKLLKKMVIQIIISLLIYGVIYRIFKQSTRSFIIWYKFWGFL